MALKPFSVNGEFSGRSTPLGGGPRLSKDKAHMHFKVLQRVNESEEIICTVESRQDRRDLTTIINVYPIDGSPAQTFEIKSHY